MSSTHPNTLPRTKASSNLLHHEIRAMTLLPDLSTASTSVDVVAEQIKKELQVENFSNSATSAKLVKRTNHIWEKIFGEPSEKAKARYRKLEFTDLWAEEAGFMKNIEVMKRARLGKDNFRIFRSGQSPVPEQHQQSHRHRRKPDICVLRPAGSLAKDVAGEDTLPSSLSLGEIWTIYREKRKTKTPSGTPPDEEDDKRLMSQVAFCFELKVRGNANKDGVRPKVSDNDISQQAIDTLRLLLSQPGIRDYAMSATIGNDELCVWFASSDGVVASQRFDIRKNPEYIVHLIVRLTHFTDEDFGCRLGMSYGRVAQNFDLTSSHFLTLIDPHSTALISSSPSSDSPTPAISTSQHHTSPIPLPPTSTTLTIHDVRITSRRLVGRRTGGFTAEITVGERSLKGFLKVSYVSQRRLDGEVDVLKLLRKERHSNLVNPIASWRSTSAVPSLSDRDGRFLTIHLLEDLRSLWDLRERVALQEIVIGIVEGLGQLLQHDIIHRDVSIGNCMFRKEEGDKYIGVLIDYDYSAKSDSKDLGTSRTGTLPFLSLNMLSGDETYIQTKYDDLQSLLYVVGWVILHRGSKDIPPTEKASAWIRGWNEGGETAIVFKSLWRREGIERLPGIEQYSPGMKVWEKLMEYAYASRTPSHKKMAEVLWTLLE